MGEVKVIGSWGSPFSKRVEMALKLKGVEYEYIEEDLANKSPLLLHYNPVHKKVPVLVHNGKPIAESLVILEYIDETWKQNPIFPHHPYDRAMARFWTKFLDDKCLPSISKIIWTKDKEREIAIEDACNNLKTIEKELKDKKLLGGDRIGVVDIVANFLGFWVKVVEEAAGFELISEDKFPKLYKWMNEFVKLGVIKENLPPRDKLLHFFQARFQSSSWKY